MRYETSVTSISWIPSEAMSGLMRLPMDVGVGHYDPPPPDRIDDAALQTLQSSDRLRFANHLRVSIEVEDGHIVDAAYSGRALVGSTTARLGGFSVVVPGVAYPVLRAEPVIDGDVARFVQTAGGRTGAPFPHLVDHPPFLRISGPTAWTTLALEVSVDGSSRFEVVGASPFPRHWIYDGSGHLALKSGLIDFARWSRTHDHGRSPWSEVDCEPLVADAESDAERAASVALMEAGAEIRRLAASDVLVEQGEPGSELYLILDGILGVEVDGEEVAEVGPGAVVGERAMLEEGVRTATVRCRTRATVAAVLPAALETDALAEIAAGHRREEA